VTFNSGVMMAYWFSLLRIDCLGGLLNLSATSPPLMGPYAQERSRAVKAQKTVIVSDVEKDDLFRPFVSFARTARFKSVLSSPLISEGVCIGVVSVHFANHCSPSPIEVGTLEEYCKLAADDLLGRLNGVSLNELSETLYKQLLAENKLAAANR
jgi:GAF domain-containing protein